MGKWMSENSTRDEDGGENIERSIGESEVLPLFCEMSQLGHDVRGRDEWKETARWVKYEEDVEPRGQRWSKPFVSTVSLNAFYELKTLFESQAVLLGLETESLQRLCGQIVEEWFSRGLVVEAERTKLLQALLRKHVHLYEEPTGVATLKMQPSCLTKKKKSRKPSLSRKPSDFYNRRQSTTSMVLRSEPEKDPSKKNLSFMRKIPSNSEAANILIGELNELQKPLAAFVRLKEARVLGNMTEVPLPTRFLFVLFVPKGHVTFREIGRAMGGLLSDPNFKEIAYHTESSEELSKGISSILNKSTVLPPSAWDSSIRIEPPSGEKSEENSDEEDGDHGEDDGLKRTGKLFGGFINDIKRKAPWYISDYKDAISLQCLATWIFLYFACLTPMITFGGLMGIVTHGNMGTMETMVSGCICGIIFALFSGQPLVILGSTGPVLVFEKILVHFCESNSLDYLEFRLWTGIWISIILLIFVALDASAFVSYITRFTEENFATLVAIIFMVEAVKNVMLIRNPKPLGSSMSLLENKSFPNSSHAWEYDYEVDSENGSFALFGKSGGVEEDSTSETQLPIFLMSLLLFFGTFFVSFMLKEFRNSSFFPTFIRSLISDFAVVIAILSMSSIDMWAGILTPKLVVPAKFAPTLDTRGWLISPMGKNPFWSIFVAGLPALLATILIFMDQQITAVIVNRKDHKLRKGCGYHLDLFVLALLIMMCSFLGIPWFVAATVESLTNVGSLKMDSESAAPGEKPTFLGVREQRLTNILIFTTVGLSVFLTPVLSHVPMPVLYGVFLYMGFSAIRKMELFERILLVLMPIKYQPEHFYLRQVPLIRVHLFTLIQLSCLALLWIIKSVKATAILFPLMLVVMMVVRKLLDFVFLQSELLALDDALPQNVKNDKIRRMSRASVSSRGNNNLSPNTQACEYKMVENKTMV